MGDELPQNEEAVKAPRLCCSISKEQDQGATLYETLAGILYAPERVVCSVRGYSVTPNKQSCDGVMVVEEIVNLLWLVWWSAHEIT